MCIISFKRFYRCVPVRGRLQRALKEVHPNQRAADFVHRLAARAGRRDLHIVRLLLALSGKAVLTLHIVNRHQLLRDFLGHVAHRHKLLAVYLPVLSVCRFVLGVPQEVGPVDDWDSLLFGDGDRDCYHISGN